MLERGMFMSTIKGRWKNGQVVLDRQVNWPEGRRLLVVEESAAEIGFMPRNSLTPTQLEIAPPAP